MKIGEYPRDTELTWDDLFVLEDPLDGTRSVSLDKLREFIAKSITGIGGLTPGSYGPDADVTGVAGAVVLIPEIIVNSAGQISNIIIRRLTIADQGGGGGGSEYFVSDTSSKMATIANPGGELRIESTRVLMGGEQGLVVGPLVPSTDKLPGRIFITDGKAQTSISEIRCTEGAAGIFYLPNKNGTATLATFEDVVNTYNELNGYISLRYPRTGGEITGSVEISGGGLSVYGANDSSGASILVGRDSYFGSRKGEIIIFGANGNSSRQRATYIRAADAPSTGSTSNVVTLPTGTGILALTSDLSNYLPKSGGTVTGALTLQGAVTLQNVLNSTNSITVNTSTSAAIIAKHSSYPNGYANISANSEGGNVRCMWTDGTRYVEMDCINGNGRIVNRPTSGTYTIQFPSSSGTFQLTSSSSRRVKENIREFEEQEASKILDIEVVKFNYIDASGDKEGDHNGVIAEDVANIIPEAVIIADGYDENEPIDDVNNPAPAVDYRKFIPHLIKMVQIQQREIDALKQEILELKQV